ncbi:MAG: hypothetical protein RLY14_3513 [Planctomycetota bacterium]|jgi:tetratricopeptide (TPR) repeat protein
MSRTPVIKPIVWSNAAINLALLALACAIGYLVHPRHGILFAAAAYVLLSVVLRGLLAKHHKLGVSLCRQNRFEEAIIEFDKSLEFFNRNEWIDRFRAVTLLSAGLPYREMALVSKAFCYAQLGQGTKAQQTYEECLRKFPESQLAASALRFLEAGKSLAKREDTRHE